MIYKRKQRIQLIVFILTGATIAIALLLSALGSNMDHYYELSVIKSDDTLLGKTIRVGGIVEHGSVKRNTGSLKVSFAITNLKDRIEVQYEGILPDLFKEGQGVLAKGQLIDKNHLIAREILAKHDENYMPKEVREELEKSGYYQHMESPYPPQREL
ncbi:MAG: cytochrome c maturation protein CcmE [Gammaproteobacteria bacterium]|nr:MAG: cytochrome c maturation protein CcmE [Gammaproteobacteria bacterium]